MTAPERSDPDGDDRELSPEAVERAFAALIAGYHLTADPARPEPHGVTPTPTGEPHTEPDRPVVRPSETRRSSPSLDSRWADEHPLFSFPVPTEPEPEPEERYQPGPPPPWPRPSAALLVGWIGVTFALITMIAAALGAPIPRWVAWTAVGAFVGGFALLLSRLPRNRPPEDGDGAVL